MKTIYQFLSSFLFMWFINTSVAKNIHTTLGSFNSMSCAVGDTINLPVNVSMASGIRTAAISMAIGYDPAKLQCLSTVTSLNSNIYAGFISHCGVFSWGASRLRAAWFNLTPVAFNGLMFNMRSKILAAGTHTFEWDLATPSNCEYADELADVIPNCDFVDGSVTCRTAAPAVEEYYYSDDSISWWRVLESSPIPNEQPTITKNQNKSDDAYVDLIREIQDYMGEVIRYTGYNGLSHGTWDGLTSGGISRWKKTFNGFEWEGGDGGDIICKSFYKTLVYNSRYEPTLLDRCIQDVSQRPRILQEAWEKNGDKQNLNAWANKYAKSWVDHMDDFQALCKINWSGVNSFKGYKELGIDEEFLDKICPSDISSIYIKLFKEKPEGGTKLDQNYKMLLAVLNEIRMQDADVIKKAFQYQALKY